MSAFILSAYRIPIAQVGFALIPNRPAHGERNERMNHPVVKGGGILHIVRRQQFVWVNRHRSEPNAWSASAWRAEATHCSVSFKTSFSRCSMLGRAGIGQLHQFVFVAQRRRRGESFRRSPRFDARAAPTRFNQPDRDAKFLVQLPPEIISCRRKPVPTTLGQPFAGEQTFHAPSILVCGKGDHFRVTNSRRIPG